ncbi:ZMYM3 protein, partial [Buphagus erythrorhynchus]|nr:ZMYM3 protein [Buphagus erythrorhynchus]
VPVPMFLPTTLESTEKIVETIEELKVKIPSNPLEADILAMAEMIAEAEELDKASSDLCGRQQLSSVLLSRESWTAQVSWGCSEHRDPDFIFPAITGKTDKRLPRKTPAPVPGRCPVSQNTSLQGQKRLVLSESCSRDSMSSQPSCTVLNYSYGVNAWKSWVQAKYAGGETSKGEELRFGPKPMRIKEDILACSAAELNYGLAQFVKEITRPNGERYEPDSIYYLCLGIQQ